MFSACAEPKSTTIEAASRGEASKLLKMKLSRGLVIGIARGERVYIEGFGSLDGRSGKAPGRKTYFQIGSVTKLFTVATYQVLCDKGMVSPNDTLGALIGDRVPLSPQTARITLDELATHRSGLPRIPRSLARNEMAFHDPEHGVTRDEALAYLVSAEGVKRPGKARYSNYGLGLLGHVLELKTGRSLDELFDDVLSPLEMRDSGLGLVSSTGAELATGHLPDGASTGFWMFTSLDGAGAMYSTVEDLLRFAEANFDPASPLYASLVNMRRPLADGKAYRGWRAPGLPEKASGNTGILWHNGMVGGSASYLAIDPERRIAIVILSNSTMDLTISGNKLMRAARRLDWDTP